MSLVARRRRARQRLLPPGYKVTLLGLGPVSGFLAGLLVHVEVAVHLDYHRFDPGIRAVDLGRHQRAREWLIGLYAPGAGLHAGMFAVIITAWVVVDCLEKRRPR